MAYRDREQKPNIFDRIAAFSDDRTKSAKKNANVQTKTSILSSANSQETEPDNATAAIDNGAGAEAGQLETQVDSNTWDQQASVEDGTYYYDNSEYNYEPVVDSNAAQLLKSNASDKRANVNSRFSDFYIKDLKLNPQTARNVIIMSEILSIPVSKRKKL